MPGRRVTRSKRAREREAESSGDEAGSHAEPAAPERRSRRSRAPRQESPSSDRSGSTASPGAESASDDFASAAVTSAPLTKGAARMAAMRERFKDIATRRAAHFARGGGAAEPRPRRKRPARSPEAGASGDASADASGAGGGVDDDEEEEREADGGGRGGSRGGAAPGAQSGASRSRDRRSIDAAGAAAAAGAASGGGDDDGDDGARPGRRAGGPTAASAASDSDGDGSTSSASEPEPEGGAWPGPYATAARLIRQRERALRRRRRRQRRAAASGTDAGPDPDSAEAQRLADPDAARVPLPPQWLPADADTAAAIAAETARARHRASQGEGATRRRGAVGLSLSQAELAPLPAGEGAVPSLQSLCVALLAQFADCIESLGPVPDGPRRRLAWGLARARKLDAQALALLAAAPATSLWAPDCSLIEDVDLIASLKRAPAGGAQAGAAELLPELAALDAPHVPAPAGQDGETAFGRVAPLRSVSLGAVGRGMTDRAARALGPALAPAIEDLHLGAPYRLDDAGLCALLGSTLPTSPGAPHLRQLSLTAASSVSGSAMRALPALLPALQRLSLDGCLKVGDGALSADGGADGRRHGAEAGSSASAFLPAELLAGSGTAVTVAPGAVVALGPLAALCARPAGVTHLRLVRLPLLSDATLAPALAAGSSRFVALELAELALVTDRSLMALADPSLEAAAAAAGPGAVSGSRGSHGETTKHSNSNGSSNGSNGASCSGGSMRGAAAGPPMGRLRSLVLCRLPRVSDTGLRALADESASQPDGGDTDAEDSARRRPLALRQLRVEHCAGVRREGTLVCLLEAAAGAGAAGAELAGSAAAHKASSSPSSSSSSAAAGAASAETAAAPAPGVPPLSQAWARGVAAAGGARASARAAAALSVALEVASAQAPSQGLRQLSMAGGGRAAGRAALAAAGKLHGASLEELDISMCREVTDDDVGALLDQCPRLQLLEVWANTQLAGEGAADPLAMHTRALAARVLDSCEPALVAEAAAALGCLAAEADAASMAPALRGPRIVGRPGARVPRPVEGKGESAGAPDWSWADA